MAALTGAGIAVPVDKELPENELQQVINRARASVVIYTPSMHIGDRLRSIMDELPTVKAFIEMKSDAPRTGRFVGIRTVIAEGRSALLAGDNTYRNAETPADDFRALFFTSGTTASSKGVMASSRQLAANINAVSAYVKLYPSDRLFSVLPLHHTYESSIGFLVPFANGASIAVNSGLKHIAEELRDSHPTIIISVPLLLESLYSNIMKSIRRSGKEDIVNAMMSITNGLKSLGIDVKRKVFKEIHEGLGGNLRLIVSAAAPIARKIGKWFSDLGVNFLQGYGLTETSPIAAVTPEYDPRVGSAGKTIAGGIIKVKNPDASGSGELMISTDTLMMGYYEDPEATAEAIETDENGRRWFNSGDLGYIDNDNFIYITGRIKNVIVTQNGKNIYPEELELLLADIPEIKECMVYGKEVDGSKELVVTCRAIPDDDRIKAMHGNVSDKEVYDIIFAKIKEVNRKVTNYKAIKRLELKDGEFIKTSTKKIKRFAEIREGKILDIGK
jgi:long-chain acyl-CoA synthetase